MTVENQLTYGALAACTDRRDPLVINGVRYVADPDPKPPTLREQVAKAWCAEIYGEYSGSAKNPSPDHLDAADAVLAVVADWLAAQPLPPVGGNYRPAYVDQRGHDVRLLRGGSDA